MLVGGCLEARWGAEGMVYGKSTHTDTNTHTNKHTKHTQTHMDIKKHTVGAHIQMSREWHGFPVNANSLMI